MTEIVVYGPAAKVAFAGLMTGLSLSSLGTIVTVVLGLLLLGAFLRQVLFTPIEEERPSAYRSAVREPLPRERCRSRGSGLLRLPRAR
jgi:hypothetical protein